MFCALNLYSNFVFIFFHFIYEYFQKFLRKSETENNNKCSAIGCLCNNTNFALFLCKSPDDLKNRVHMENICSRREKDIIIIKNCKHSVRRTGILIQKIQLYIYLKNRKFYYNLVKQQYPDVNNAFRILSGALF